MNVIDILNNIGLLGVGLENPTPEDQAVFLEFLNLAHCELFRETAKFNPMAIELQEIVNANNGVLDHLTQTPCLITGTYIVNQNTSLRPTDIHLIRKQDPSVSKAATIPWGWYYYNNTLNVYPLYTGQIGVYYFANPTPFLATTIEANIPYPVTYHPVLIDGACYYLFQGETGFKDPVKMQSALVKWKRGKTQLLSYLTSLAGKIVYSTFSKV